MSLEHDSERDAERALAAPTLDQLILLRRGSTRPWLILPEAPLKTDAARRLSFEEVYAESARVARAFRALGAAPGRVVGLVASNSPEFVYLLFGAWLAGLVPAPLHLPFFVTKWEEYVARIGDVLAESNAQFLVTGDDFSSLVDALGNRGFHARSFSALHALGATAPDLDALGPSTLPHDTGLIQFSSGSTRLPIGVELRHENVLRNVDAIGRAIGADPDEDVAMTWLPLFHDMGLTGTLVYSWYWGLPLVLMSPQQFIASPAGWLWAIARFRVTGCAAPNFAYGLVSDRTRIKDGALANLDLSSWRVALNGADIVQERTLQAFTDRFAPYGLRADVMRPAYGLAENVVACCVPRAGQPSKVDHVDRLALETAGEARPLEASSEERVRSLVSVGTPVEGTQIRIVGESGERLSARRVGAIEITGTSVMKGYFERPQETEAAFTKDGWLRTGDLGYVADGELFVVGRSKDVIKKAGAKYDAADVQSLVSEVPGVRPSCVAAFSVESPEQGTELLVVVAETRLTDSGELQLLQETVRKAISRTFGTNVDILQFAPPNTLDKTTSGKVRTKDCRARFLNGDLPALTAN